MQRKYPGNVTQVTINYRIFLESCFDVSKDKLGKDALPQRVNEGIYLHLKNNIQTNSNKEIYKSEPLRGLRNFLIDRYAIRNHFKKWTKQIKKYRSSELCTETTEHDI